MKNIFERAQVNLFDEIIVDNFVRFLRRRLRNLTVRCELWEKQSKIWNRKSGIW